MTAFRYTGLSLARTGVVIAFAVVSGGHGFAQNAARPGSTDGVDASMSDQPGEAAELRLNAADERDPNLPPPEPDAIDAAPAVDIPALRQGDDPQPPRRARRNSAAPVDGLDGDVPQAFRALGLRAGRFIVYPSIETGVRASGNVLQANGRSRADIGVVIEPRLRIESDWLRHQFTANLRGEYLRYRRAASQREREIELDLVGRIDVLRGSTIDLAFAVRRSQESRGGADRQADASELAHETSLSGSVGATHKFNRLQLGLRTGFETFFFSDVPTTSGTDTSNGDRDYTEYQLAFRPAYEFSPALTGFLEATYQPRSHTQRLDDNGFARDSQGYELLAGVKFDIDAIWQGSAALGYEWRHFDDARLDMASALVARAGITWRPSRLTKIGFTAESQLEETTVAGVSAARSYSFGTRIDHSLKRDLIAFAALEFEITDFASNSLLERRWDVEAGLEYFLNRRMSVIAKYEFDRFWTNQGDGTFMVNAATLSFKLRR